ncbi:hypothetical protein [Fretibacter rubidus]|uniref:hypothetical protein n=1 Tax=Fretibacter rubidus TaxID=570162 RepID=UPI00352B9209
MSQVQKILDMNWGLNKVITRVLLATGVAVTALNMAACSAHSSDSSDSQSPNIKADFPNPASDSATGWTPERYKTWVRSRAGTGDPVYWYSVGTLRAFPGGKLLYNFEGYDAGRAERISPTMTNQYSRKVYFYRDIETNEVIREVNGEPVEPIAYPYQFITYEYKTDKDEPYLQTMVEQGTAPNVRSIGPGTDITVRQIGNLGLYTAPLFLDFEIPGQSQRYQTFENYDFVIPQDDSQPGMITFMRYGPLPKWAQFTDENGTLVTQGAMHMTTWRIADYNNVPKTLRDYVESDAPLWREPPKDLADIRRLQGVSE